MRSSSLRSCRVEGKDEDDAPVSTEDTARESWRLVGVVGFGGGEDVMGMLVARLTRGGKEESVSGCFTRLIVSGLEGLSRIERDSMNSVRSGGGVVLVLES